MLVGHPGEGEKEFEELKDFVREFRFDRLGVFPYSHEEGTYGYEHFTDEVPQEVKERRVEELMQIQQEISADLNMARKGREYRVLIDRKEGEYYVGRTEYDSPEVDNEVLISQGENPLTIGEFHQVRITDATDFDLFGVVVDS